MITPDDSPAASPVSLRRVAGASVVALVGPTAFAALVALAAGGRFEFTGMIAVFVGLGLIGVGAYAVTRLGQFRSPLLGILCALPPAAASVVGGSPLGALLVLLAGWIGGSIARRPLDRRLPDRGPLLVLLLTVAVTIPTAAFARVSPERAVLQGWDGAHALATVLREDEAIVLIATPGRAETFRVVHARPKGLGSWASVEPATPFPSLFGRAPFASGALIEGCNPNGHATQAEALALCFTDSSVIAGTAPATAVTLELEYLDGRIVTIPLARGPVRGFLLDRRSYLAWPVRFAFRDGRGRLLDARLAMEYQQEIALEWIEAGASCTTAHPGCRERFETGMISFSVLRRDELEATCGGKAPSTPFVVLADVFHTHSGRPIPPPSDTDRRMLGSGVRRLVGGLTASGTFTRPVQLPPTNAPCFPTQLNAWG